MARTESPIEVANEYVTVRKTRVDTEKEGVLGVELRFSTVADGPVDVRVVEQLPEIVSMKDIGLHPGFKPGNWTIYEDERRLVYEDVVSPDEELVTLYGVLTENYDDLEPFLGEPVIELAEPAERGDDGEGSDAGFMNESGVFNESLLGGPANGEAAESSESRSSQPGPSAEPAGDAGDAGDETEDRAFVYEGEQLEESSLLGTDDAPSDGDERDAEAAGTGAAEVSGAESASVVSALLDELEDEETGDDQLDALREALGVETSDSMRVRLSHLQSEVATLSAFGDEFERFVDQEGGLGEVVDDLREGLGRVEEELDEFSSDVREQLDEVDEVPKKVRKRLRRVDDRVGELADDLESAADQREDIREAHDDDVDRLDDRFEELETAYDSTIEAVRDDVERLDEDLDAEREWRRSLVESFGDIVNKSFDGVVDETPDIEGDDESSR